MQPATVTPDANPAPAAGHALAPLRECRSLRRLELFVNDVRGEPGFDDKTLRAQLGDRIELHVQRGVFTIKR